MIKKVIILGLIVVAVVLLAYFQVYHGLEGKKFASTISEIRFTQVLGAFLAGAILSLAGYVLQYVLNNPLADPFILGTAGGAALGANLSYTGVLPLMMFGMYMPLFSSLVFAVLITAFVVFFIGGKEGRSVNMLLGGMAMASLVGAATSVLIYISDDAEKIRTIVYWAMGGFELATFPMLVYASIFLLGLLVYLFLKTEILKLFSLGEERALALGFNVRKHKLLLIILVTIPVSIIVSHCGPIGFVGLIVPHITRAIHHRISIYSMLLVTLSGGAFLMLCQVLGKLLYPPVGLPIGVVTSLIGVPIFIYILIRRNYKFTS